MDEGDKSEMETVMIRRGERGMGWMGIQWPASLGCGETIEIENNQDYEKAL